MTCVRRVLVLLAAGLFVGAVDCTAQQLSISGTVDDTHGVVSDGSVTLRTQAGSTQKTMTDAEGRYTFSGLTPGSYEVSVAKEGFTSTTRGLALTTQSRTADLTLTIFVSQINSSQFYPGPPFNATVSLRYRFN